MPDRGFLTRRLLLTRPLAASQQFAARLPVGWQAHIAPMQDIVDLPASPDFTGVSGLVFTSANGVRSFARRWARRRDLPAYCVGDATADTARQLGFEAHSADGNRHDLAAVLTGLPKARLLYLHGRYRQGDISAEGQQITSLAIYDQLALPLDATTRADLAAGRIAAVALFSPRSAALLAAEQRNWPEMICFCISDAVAQAAQPLGRCIVAARPDANAMLATIGTFDGS